MKNEKGIEKKGLFARLAESKKSKKNSCCCNIELEDIPEENNKNASESTAKEKSPDSCC